MNRAAVSPVIQALLAAVLFGVSAPLAKLLLGQVEPVTLAALLYLGCGVGVLLFKLLPGGFLADRSSQAHIVRADFRWLLGAVIAGGVAAPILLLFSLRNTPASTASLLLNFEGVATTLIAALVFRESISRWALAAILFVTFASIVLSWDQSGQWGLSLGALGAILAMIPLSRSAFWGPACFGESTTILPASSPPKTR